MALIKCKDCGLLVNENAPNCPSCGAKIKMFSTTSKLCLALLGFVLLIVFTSTVNQQKSTSLSNSTISSQTALALEKVAQQEIEYLIGKLQRDIIVEYRGKIISIEKLDGTTCWARLNPSLGHNGAIKACQNIGYYLRNASGGKIAPVVHVFFGNTHVAQAYPPGYEATLKIDRWE